VNGYPWARRGLVAGLLLALAGVPAAAQDYPIRPIKLIVGFPPGGGVDLVARLIGQEMSKNLGLSIIVENKPGAAGTIGAANAGDGDRGEVPACALPRNRIA
jgi:tripartite-type tricarboxylate transporter receptor subunit TctC